MEIVFILGLTIRIFILILNFFLSTKLIYPVCLLSLMSFLLNRGIFVDYWEIYNPFYWLFYLLLLISLIPFLKKIKSKLKNILRR